MGFISLKYDFSFKRLMENEEVRRYFISDVLEIPPEEIKSVRLRNPYLWRWNIRQKQGIVDMLLDLNDDRKVNIELQIRNVKQWDKRALFYLAKMFTSDLQVGENYQKLKKCISISILDFNLDKRPEYHKVYRLLDKDGYVFSDMFELHIIELRKQLDGSGRMDDWIRLINAETKEDLNMIKTDNLGILAAIREVKVMGIGRTLRVLYEAHLKEIRDRKAMDEYVYDEGFQCGEARGEAKGRMLARIGIIRKNIAKNMPIEDMAEILGEEVSFIREVYGLITAHPAWNDDKIFLEVSKDSERN